MKIIVGCEESQEVCLAFRKLGHEAFSCDLQHCSGGHPEWHIISDIFKIIEGGFFNTENGDLHNVWDWDMGIFHPPCTYLTVTANRWLKDQPKLKSGALVGEARREARREATEFFIKLLNVNIQKICLENPVGIINSIVKPTQLIHPYYFGDEARKATCLWLKNLPPLFHAKEPDLFNNEITHVDEGESVYWIDSKTGKQKRQPLWYAKAKRGKELGDRSMERSKTFPGIATAMAQQWG